MCFRCRVGECVGVIVFFKVCISGENFKLTTLGTGTLAFPNSEVKFGWSV